MRTVAKFAAVASVASGALLVGVVAILKRFPHLWLRILQRSSKHPRFEDGRLVQPVSPPAFPLGHLGQWRSLGISTVLENFRQLPDSARGFSAKYVLGKTYLAIVDNDAAVKELLGAKISVNGSVRSLHKVLPVWNRLFGKGLFMLSPKDWKRVHRIAMRGLGPKQIEKFIPVIHSEVTARLEVLTQKVRIVDNLAKGKGEIHSDFLQDMALSVVSAVAFGRDIPEEDRAAIIALLDLFGKYDDMKMKLPGYLDLPVSQSKNLRKVIDDLHAIAYKFIAKQREMPPTAEEGPLTLLSVLLQARDEEGGCLDEEDVAHNVYAFMLAGIGTTSDTLATCLSMLARHPAVQSRLREELCSVETWADLRDKFYLGAVITETLRLWPAITNMPGRELTSPIVLEGVRVPAGCDIVVDTIPLQRRRHVWGEDADEFRPERFLCDVDALMRSLPNPTLPLPPPPGVPETAFLAFGGGARPCIGRPLAMIEMKLVLFELLKRYELEEVAPDDFEMQIDSPSCRPKDFKLRLKAL